MPSLDAIIVGAGHNGLTCAAYLGMAGLRVRVFERRSVVGGACVTEEFYPGFRNSTAAYTVSLLQPKVIQDLKLHERGLRVVERRAQNFLPLPDGRYLLTGARQLVRIRFHQGSARLRCSKRQSRQSLCALWQADSLKAAFQLFRRSAGDIIFAKDPRSPPASITADII
jgi:phytoene dehydrogenase-like protein